MANSLNNTTFQQYWAKRMQRKHQKVAVYRAIANFEEQALLRQGDTVHRPYRSAINAQAYTRGTSVTIQDLTNTDETLVVNQAQTVPFYIDDLDQLQSNYRFINEYADDAAVELTNFIDSDILDEGRNSASTVIDDKSVNGAAGTSGNGITIDVTNIQKVFSTALAKFGRLNTRKNLFAVINPDTHQVLLDYLAGKNTNLGDEKSENGYVGKYYDFEIYVSNNLSFTAALTLATNPNNNDTLTITGYDRNGVKQAVTFTFVTSIGTTPGNVLIGAAASNTQTNLKGLLDAQGTTNTTQVALSAASQQALGWVTTGSWAANVLKPLFKGVSFLQLASNLTASTTDGWATATQICHCLFGSKGATDVVIQQMPKVEIKEVQDKLGKNILPWILYGKKTFNEGKGMLTDVQIRTDALTA